MEKELKKLLKKYRIKDDHKTNALLFDVYNAYYNGELNEKYGTDFQLFRDFNKLLDFYNIKEKSRIKYKSFILEFLELTKRIRGDNESEKTNKEKIL